MATEAMDWTGIAPQSATVAFVGLGLPFLAVAIIGSLALLLDGGPPYSRFAVMGLASAGIWVIIIAAIWLWAFFHTPF
jgi:hypothetical protein